MLVEPFLTTFVAMLLVAWLVVRAGASVGDGVLVLWWLWLLLVARLVWKVLEWRNEWFVATDKRLLLLYGLITHKVAMMPLTKVTDMNYGRSLVGRVLGYGQFLLESAGQDQALRRIDWVARPEATYRRICDTLFGPGGPSARPGTAPATVPVAPDRAAAAAPGRTSREPAVPSEPVVYDGPPSGDAWDRPPVDPADAWEHPPTDQAAPGTASSRSAPPVVVVPGQATGEAPGQASPRPGRRGSGQTQPIPVRGRADEDEDEERGWAVSGEHRATYVPVVHPPQRLTPPLPKPYEPGPGRDEAP
ncbi:PH domain-containing protein [Cellulosimicrobium terreum]|nr:PH domain-containing protein [Cellulosimicrobium terreum]